MYRLMVHDRNTLGCLFPAQQHIGQIYQKYEGMNKPMPVAVAIGGQPSYRGELRDVAALCQRG
jgi:4-hydroxy-3-polyprenylbenzoate decarboxylase